MTPSPTSVSLWMEVSAQVRTVVFLLPRVLLRLTLVWAATVRDDNFVRMEGLKRMVSRPKHRKELVAGGLADYLTAGTPNSFLTSRAVLTSF